MRPTLKPPGCKRLKLNCNIPLSNFAFKFNLRRYNLAAVAGPGRARALLPAGYKAPWSSTTVGVTATATIRPDPQAASTDVKGFGHGPKSGTVSAVGLRVPPDGGGGGGDPAVTTPRSVAASKAACLLKRGLRQRQQAEADGAGYTPGKSSEAKSPFSTASLAAKKKTVSPKVGPAGICQHYFWA
jgi:hypothetical protein